MLIRLRPISWFSGTGIVGHHLACVVAMFNSLLNKG